MLSFGGPFHSKITELELALWKAVTEESLFIAYSLKWSAYY